MSDAVRCNNCWAVFHKPLLDGSCPKCGCFIHHADARMRKVYHGVSWACHRYLCPRRFDNGKTYDDS